MTDQPALPDFLEPLLASQYGSDDVRRIVEGCAAKRPVTLRANALLADRDEVAHALDAAGIGWEAVGWYEDAFIIRDAHERDLWELPLYREGKVYLQSLSSMLPALVLNAQPGEDVCDLCAAPGGKTTQIAALSMQAGLHAAETELAQSASSANPAEPTEGSGSHPAQPAIQQPRTYAQEIAHAKGAFITACEMHAPRAEKLEHNLGKLGAHNVTVMRVDARRLDDFFSFDRILLDAPCSGSGTLRAGDPKTARRFTQALIDKSRKSQRALFDKALSLMKVGSTLVYSTCSVLECENEDIVRDGIRAARKRGTFEVQDIAVPGMDGLPLLPTTIGGTLCLCPTQLYEGFFIATIKRTA